MPIDPDGALANTMRGLARILPPLAFLLALAFLGAAVAVGFLGAGNYASEAEATDAAMLLLLFAVVAFAIGRWTPRVVKRLLGADVDA